jgi:hypothetical protein
VVEVALELSLAGLDASLVVVVISLVVVAETEIELLLSDPNLQEHAEETATSSPRQLSRYSGRPVVPVDTDWV